MEKADSIKNMWFRRRLTMAYERVQLICDDEAVRLKYQNKAEDVNSIEECPAFKRHCTVAVDMVVCFLLALAVISYIHRLPIVAVLIFFLYVAVAIAITTLRSKLYIVNGNILLAESEEQESFIQLCHEKLNKKRKEEVSEHSEHGEKD